MPWKTVDDMARIAGPPPRLRVPTVIQLPIFIRVWFAADLILALLPPLHWWAGTGDPLFGVPRMLVYLFGTSAFIAASVVVAYLCDAGRTTR